MTICGIPLVLLVVGVGETPRHYIAELALVLLSGTIGWYHGILRLRERDRLTAVLFSALALLWLLYPRASTLQRITPKVVIAGLVGPVVLVLGLRRRPCACSAADGRLSRPAWCC